MSTKIVIVDDHVLLRKGLVEFVKTIPNCDVVGEAGNHEEFFSLLKSVTPDIIILDVSLPKKNGFQIFKELKALKPQIKVLFFTLTHGPLPSRERGFNIKAFPIFFSRCSRVKSF